MRSAHKQKNPTISNVKSLDLWSEWRESNSRPLEPHAEYSKLLTEKKVRYPDYRKAKEEMQELLRAKRNVEMFFAEEKSIAEKMKSR